MFSGGKLQIRLHPGRVLQEQIATCVLIPIQVIIGFQLVHPHTNILHQMVK